MDSVQVLEDLKSHTSEAQQASIVVDDDSGIAILVTTLPFLSLPFYSIIAESLIVTFITYTVIEHLVPLVDVIQILETTLADRK